MVSVWRGACAALVLACLGPSAWAQGARISLHGYGGWAVGYSDPYRYLGGSGDGEANFENANFVLLLDAQVSEKLRVVFAPEFEIQEGEEETTAELIYAEWAATDHLRVQLGRGRLPFGLYADIYDVGTLRPFYDLPQTVYGNNGFVTEFFDGIGLIGRGTDAGDWTVQWNAVVGGATLNIEEPFERLVPGAAPATFEGDAPPAESEIEILTGGRILLGTPVEGLSLAVSGFVGKPAVAGDFASGRKPQFGDFSSYALSAEWLRGPFVGRLELGRHGDDEFDTDAGFFEASYRLGDHWQVAGRYDRSRVDFVEDLPAASESALEHDEIGVGLNYWFDANSVLKASYHRVDGNLFAHPGLDELAPGVPLDRKTDLVLFGAQFSF